MTAFSFIFTVGNIFFSGVAAVLELARQFVESHCKPKNTIIFATFDLEEMGGQVSHIF
jgi:Zn-dependent M28 family amino/carboxypeptidase